MSLLADIETTFDNGTILSTRNKIFDVLFNDMLVLSNDPYLSIRHLILLAKKTFSMVKAYELIDKFGVELHELKLLFSSDYIVYSTFHNINNSRLYRVYGNDIGTCIDFNIDKKNILEYLENPSIVTQSYYNYCHSQKIYDRRDTPIYNIYDNSSPEYLEYNYFANLFKKQILDFNIVISAKFWEEFEEYAKDKIISWY